MSCILQTKEIELLILLIILASSSLTVLGFIQYASKKMDKTVEDKDQVLLLSKRSDDDLINIGSVTNDSCTVDKSLTIEYSEIAIECGEVYHLAGFDLAPVLHLNRANVNKHYTLMMVDPDAPDPKKPKYRSWLHWLIVNIVDADIKSGFEVAEYKPPTPPLGSGLHRYVFLVVEQTEAHTHYFPVHKRASFDVNKYAKEQKLGNIAGISFFQTENKGK